MGLFSEFPDSEYHARYERLIAGGKRRGIDGFVFTDEFNIRYLAGGPLSDAFILRNDFLCLIVPTDSSLNPALVLSESRWAATRPSWISDTRLWGGGIDAADANTTTNLLLTALKDKGLAEGTVAMEIGTSETLYMPITHFRTIEEAMPHMRIVSAHECMLSTRAIKSTAEIERMRTACEITSAAIEKGFRDIKAGSTEKDISRAVKSEMFRLGADSVPFLATIAGWEGRSICWDSHATDYAIKTGDVIQIDGGCAVSGYTADMSRTAALGHVQNKRYLDLYDAILAAQQAVRSTLTAGAAIRDVCTAGRDSLINQGYGELLVYGEGQTGHGIGLDLHEAPFLERTSTDRLSAGMVIAAEPALLEWPGMKESTYFTIVENNYVVTSSGYEQLTNSPEEIRIL